MKPEDIREKISEHTATIIEEIERLNIRMGILSIRNPKPQDEIDQLKEEVKALMEQAIRVVEAEKRYDSYMDKIREDLR